jgi:hypothetical protein
MNDDEAYFVFVKDAKAIGKKNLSGAAKLMIIKVGKHSTWILNDVTQDKYVKL